MFSEEKKTACSRSTGRYPNARSRLRWFWRTRNGSPCKLRRKGGKCFRYPRPSSKRSFNHAIASAVIDVLKSNGHEVRFHGLSEEKFDPILTGEEIPNSAPITQAIRQHCEEISKAEGIVIVHPNWWGQPPAILKGWVHKIMRPGTAYELVEGDIGEGVPIGLLKARAALLFNTSNTPADRERSLFGDPLERIWKPVSLASAA